MAKRTTQNNEPEPTEVEEPVQTEVEEPMPAQKIDVIESPATVQTTVRTDMGGAVAGGATAPTRVIIREPTVQYAKSRFAHRAAIRQWKLSKLMMGRRAF
jgi:hypothetical protein